MTGYGKASVDLERGKLTIEIRSVNGKSADIGIKTSLIPKDKELYIRKKIADRLQRGTIDLFATWESNSGEAAKQIDKDLALGYYRQIKELCDTLGTSDLENDNPNQLLATLLQMPGVMDMKKQDIIDDDNWEIVDRTIDEALGQIDSFRTTEGAALYKDVTGRVSNILNLEDEIEKHEVERMENVKTRIRKAAEEANVKLDPERYEQEMIFYLEKLDINEEKVRLRQHCRYFMETIDNEEFPGKKLGFIIQEMGREINTTGSKANNADIQKCVVMMKDELEKIREQSLNIL